ncbi:hypothetical protein [Vibrio jasicida]|uniref:hypothetical protein n=1 Tax=Vibrio jasicida TaxID=766224 RepID=UPI000CE4C732|nr:hypothetical protein [Vibrio jasicida]
MTKIQIIDTASGEVVSRDSSEMNNEDMATEALNQFGYAFENQLIDVQVGEIHSDICLHFDRPMGEVRFTYGLLVKGELSSVAVMTGSQPYKGKLCFDVGYATKEDKKRKGYGRDVMTKAIDELSNGMFRNGVRSFYLEMKVEASNLGSNAIASSIATESEFGENMNRYFKLIEL